MMRSARGWLAAFGLLALCLYSRELWAQPADKMVYRSVAGLSSRTVVWIVAELHLLFGAFVLGVPIFAVIVELVGKRTGDRRYDKLAHEFTRLLFAAFATTAALGGLLAFVLVGLYPTVMRVLGNAMHKSFYPYALLFFAEAFTLYIYYYAWDRMQRTEPNARKLRKAAWWAASAAGLALVATMLFVGGNEKAARAEGEQAADRLGKVADGVEQHVHKDAEAERVGAQTRVARWTSRVEKQVATLHGGLADGVYKKSSERVLAIALSTLKDAPKNASADQILASFKIAIDAAQGTAKLEGARRADQISASRWSTIAWVAVAFLLFLGVACWASGSKTLHLYCGLLLNLFGLVLMVIANSWASFMMSPTGYNEATFVYEGSTWGAMNNPLWHALNLHRLLANVVFGAFIVAAYAAVKFLGARGQEQRAHYDWMGYVGNFVGFVAMIPLPFAGYFYGREIYSYSPIMGNNMMGGAFSWGFIFQAVLIGVLFLGANYYLWVGMQRIPGAERYRRFIPWYALVLLVSFAVWITPHNLPLSGEERALMGGAQYHPVLKYLGLMPAKNAVVNLVILTTFFCFLMYRRANRGAVRRFREQGKSVWVWLVVATALVSAMLGGYASKLAGLDLAEMSIAKENAWVITGAVAALLVELLCGVVAAVLTVFDRGKLGQAIYFAVTALLVAGFLAVWGFFTMMHANAFLRQLAVCQVLMVLAAMALGGVIDVILFRGAKRMGGIRWGQMPPRSQYTLVVVAVAVVQLMALMGFIRSALREDWHVYGVVRDTSSAANTPTLAEMSRIAALITLLFFSLIAFVFWLGGLSQRRQQQPAGGSSAEEGLESGDRA